MMTLAPHQSNCLTCDQDTQELQSWQAEGIKILNGNRLKS